MRLMASSEATGDSCRLYLAWATATSPRCSICRTFCRRR